MYMFTKIRNLGEMLLIEKLIVKNEEMRFGDV